VYGEFGFMSLVALFRKYSDQIPRRAVVADLGSGVGRPLFAAACLRPDIARCVGVEKLRGLHELAGELMQRSVDLLDLSADTDADVLVNAITRQESMIKESHREPLRKLVKKLQSKLRAVSTKSFSKMESFPRSGMNLSERPRPRSWSRSGPGSPPQWGSCGASGRR